MEFSFEKTGESKDLQSVESRPEGEANETNQNAPGRATVMRRLCSPDPLDLVLYSDCSLNVSTASSGAELSSDSAGIASENEKNGWILTLADGRVAHLDAEIEPESANKNGGTLINDSSQPLSYVANGKDGKCHLYVLNPGEQSGQGVDVDAVVKDPVYQPIKGADGQWHAVEIPAAKAKDVQVVKIGDGTTARYDSKGNLVTQRGISDAPVAHTIESFGLGAVAEAILQRQVVHAKLKNAADFAGAGQPLTPEPRRVRP